jgi:metal-responsive CopG/Arc/MetJ family transcriptional regulator
VARKAARKVPGRTWQHVSVKVPLDLLRQIDELAISDERARSKIMERAAREYVSRHLPAPGEATAGR